MKPYATGHVAERGFTLVEMIVVAAMMSVLAMAVVPLAEINQTRWKERELRAGLWEIRQAIDAYKRLSDEAAAGRPQQRSGFPPTLAALVESSPALLRRVPRDPFAPDGVPAEQSWGLRSYASPAQAPRPGDDVYDVYSLSPRVGSNGITLARW